MSLNRLVNLLTQICKGEGYGLAITHEGMAKGE
jgi:hypothetical protein